MDWRVTMKNPCFIHASMGFLPFTFEPLFFAVCLAALMVAVMVYDARRYIIPNTLNAAVIVLYPFAAFFLGLDYASALMAAGIVLLFGLGIFAFGIMGGGDVKLMVALSLWTGFGEPLLQFLFLMALAGGALAICCLLLRYTLGRVWHKLFKRVPRPRLLTPGESIPYGIAIAGGFLWMLAEGKVPGIVY